MKHWYVRHVTSHEDLAVILNAIEQEGGVVFAVLTEGPEDGFYFTVIAYREAPADR